MAPLIPTDIIYLIIDLLSSDALNLKQCSLVSRSFLQPSRKLLFSSVSLDHPNQCRSLHRVISFNPSLAGYIRTMEVIACVKEEFRYRDWVTIEHTLAPLLQMLHSLDSFTLRDEFRVPLPWNALPLDLRMAILDITAALLTFRWIAHLPMESFGRLTHLKHLRLIDIVSDSQSHPLDLNLLGTQSPPISPVGYLETLRVINSQRCGQDLVVALTDPRSRLLLTNLKELVLSGNCAFAKRIMEVSANSLQRIAWSALGEEKEGPFLSFPLSLYSLPALTSISFSTMFAREQAHDPLPHLAHSLSHCSSASALSHLSVDIDFYGVWKFSITARDFDAVDKYAFWPELDQALTRPHVYQCLQTVMIRLRIGGGGEMFRGLEKRRLHTLMEIGVLRMAYTDK